MNATSVHRSCSRRSTRIFCLLVLIAAGTLEASDGAHGPCPDAVPIRLNDTLWVAAEPARAPHCFEVALPAGGVLLLTLATPGPAEAEPELRFLGRARGASLAGGGLTGEDVTLVRRDPSRLLLVVRGAGTYHFRVAAQTSTAAPGEYRLRTAFLGETALLEALLYFAESFLGPADTADPWGTGRWPQKPEDEAEGGIDPWDVERLLNLFQRDEIDPWEIERCPVGTEPSQLIGCRI